VLHTLRATPETCFWGFFDAALPPVLRVRSGDLVRIETLTHQAGDAPDLTLRRRARRRRRLSEPGLGAS
jgi:acetamidase/formamidase